jgi:hypothetical protein
MPAGERRGGIVVIQEIDDTAVEAGHGFGCADQASDGAATADRPLAFPESVLA